MAMVYRRTATICHSNNLCFHCQARNEKDGRQHSASQLLGWKSKSAVFVLYGKSPLPYNRQGAFLFQGSSLERG